jgi:hypothetical protein
LSKAARLFKKDRCRAVLVRKWNEKKKWYVHMTFGASLVIPTDRRGHFKAHGVTYGTISGVATVIEVIGLDWAGND